MKKINVILNETTILDFPFLFELCRRYLLITLFVPFAVCVMGYYYYSSQHTIFNKSINFKLASNDKDSANNAIASLLGEKTKSLTPSEVMGISKSRDFYQKLALRVYAHEQFPELDFNNIYERNRKKHSDFFGSCNNNQDCVVERLKKLLPHLYMVHQDRVISTHFSLEVSTLDPKTTEVLLAVVSDEIVKIRVKQIQRFVDEQKKLTLGLINQKKKELDNLSKHGLQDKLLAIENDLADINRQLIMSRTALHQEKIRYEFAKNKAAEYLRIKKSGANVKGPESASEEEIKKFNVLKERIDNIEDDINALEVVSITKAKENQVILKQLKEELKIKKSQLREMGDPSRYLAGHENQFVQFSTRQADYSEFDHKVLEKQYKKLDQEVESLEKKRSKLEVKYRDVKRVIDEDEPHFAYLKILEEKLQRAKLMEATIISDLIFDKNTSPTFSYKLTGFVNIALFSFAFSVFLTFLLLIGRYLLDNRIYNEYELRKNFENLNILGITPEFKELN